MVTLLQYQETLIYSLALDESADQSETAQLVIFIRRIAINFNTIEEMFNWCHIMSIQQGMTYMSL